MIPYTALRHYGKGTALCREWHDGIQHKYLFPNNHGASVVRNSWSYGGGRGLWELAVTDINGDLDYSTPVTSDVIGYLTWPQVQVLLHWISILPPAS